MDQEFEEVMKIFRSNLSFDDIQLSIQNYITNQDLQYQNFIEKEEYKSAYITSRKICIILQQNLKQLCLKISDQLPYIKDIKELIITILDENRQFSEFEIQQLFEKKIKIKKYDDELHLELRKYHEYLEDYIFILISHVNNIGIMQILRKKIVSGLYFICRAMLIRSFIMTKHLYLYQLILLQLNICAGLKLLENYKLTVSLLPIPMSLLENFVQETNNHDFIVKNKIIFSLIEYLVNNNQIGQIPYPKQIPSFQLQYHLLLGYQFYAKIFEILGKKHYYQECIQYYNRLYDEYKRIFPKGFELLKLQQENQINKKKIKKDDGIKNNISKNQSQRIEKLKSSEEEDQDKVLMKEIKDDEIIFFKECEEYNVAMNLLEEQGCLIIVIYSVSQGFVKKIYISLQDLKGDPTDKEICEDLFDQIQIIDLEKAKFDLIHTKWYETLTGCIAKIRN